MQSESVDQKSQTDNELITKVSFPLIVKKLTLFRQPEQILFTANQLEIKSAKHSMLIISLLKLR